MNLPMTIPTKWLTATRVALLDNAALPSFSTKQNVSFADTFFVTYAQIYFQKFFRTWLFVENKF